MPEKKKADSTDAGQAEVQQRMDVEQAQGFAGVETDKTPNEAYTVAGVTSGAPTPETDAALEREARDAAGIGTGPIEDAQRRARERGETPPASQDKAASE